MLCCRTFCAGLLIFFLLGAMGQARRPQSHAIGIAITVDKSQIGEGQNVVVTALAKHANGDPATDLNLHAIVNGREWGAEYPTLPSGVAHLLLPLPEVGANSIVVTDGTATSSSVVVQVHPRHFDVVLDPDHLVGMEYETWFGPGYAQWGHEEAVPILGHYSSLDERVLRQQTLWLNETGINFVETDWTNNLTSAFPNAAAQECIDSTDRLLELYLKMKQHPRVVFLVGPEHNLWRNDQDKYDGPWYKAQMDYLDRHYLHNPRYQEMWLIYDGKPLVTYYLNGPRTGPPPHIVDPRFTIRYVSAWLQHTHADKYGAWSWYDQEATPTYRDGKVEALTVTDGYPAVHAPGKGLNNWIAADAGGKNYGQTYRTQWEAARKYRPRFLFINQWNEFVPPDQYNVNLSNDLEPTLITEKGDPRPSGWGFEYLNMTREEIQRYHEVISKEQNRRP